MADINPFIDVEINELPEPDTLRGFDDFRRISALEVGTGNRAFKSDESGIWLGANKFADAPFTVDMEGALAAKSATFKDGDDTTIIDATGLVSTANFANGVGAYTGAGTVQITNASGWSSWADIGNNLTQTFTLARTTNVYFYHIGNYEMNGDATVINHAMQIRMDLNGTKIGTIILLQTGSGANLNKRMSTYPLAQIASVPSGSNTIKMQWRVYEGTATLAGTTFLEIGSGESAAELGFIVLGS